MPTDQDSVYSYFTLRNVTAGLLGAIGVTILFAKYRKMICNNLKLPFGYRTTLQNQRIQVVNTNEDCVQAVKKLRAACSMYKVLGFDCEWVSKNEKRQPVALLQLASRDGHCVLIRLCKIRSIPNELKILLEDETILKVGVAIFDDVNKLYDDYSINVNGTVDLRYLAVLLSDPPRGLSTMAARYLKFKMDKYWKIRCSDWEANELSFRQQTYAATDAHVAVGIFEKCMDKILKNNSSFKTCAWKDIADICKSYLDIGFRENKSNNYGTNETNSLPTFKQLLSSQQRERLLEPKISRQNRKLSRQLKTRPPYENCFMETKEGQVLCTCDRKKVEWYVEKKIADIVCDDPFTIRLKFDPAGCSVGDVNKFYQIPRDNRCVVCGQEHSYIRKHVIPKEYRKLFPLIMKDHSSHDVLLLCDKCHQRSNMRDQTLRMQLATMCNAPIINKDQPKLLEDADIKKVISAARALLQPPSKNIIPYERKIALRNVIEEYYPNKILTTEFLSKIANLDARTENPLYEAHGEIVVNYFKETPGGLLELERLWRKHFLSTMEPNFMPQLWSIEHSKSRLEQRATEGRIEEKDLSILGLTC